MENKKIAPTGILSIRSKCKSLQAFTLVELIVVITIIAILGTIAFISLQGYSRDARDSVRISDISKIKTSLELFQLDAGKYPDTTTPTTITYSGAVAWTQGTFGEATFNNVTKLDKIPLDPVTDRQYVYSVTNTKQEYQLAGIMEGDEVTGLFNQTNAALKTAMVKISGNFNGKLLKVSTGTIDYILAMPSIVTSSGITVENIVSNNLLAYNGYKNLPSQYAGSSYDVLGNDGLNLVNSDDLVVYSGDLKILSSTEPAGIDARKNLIIKLQNAYTGTDIISVGEIAQIINTQTTDASATEALSSTIVSNNLGGNIIASISRTNACVTQPEYTGATYEIGVATQPDQAWQSSNASLACYWTCGAGKVLDENTCVSETCAGTTPDGSVKVSNATSFAGGTWVYNITPGKCTYSCGALYHTEDNNNCISNTKSCAITHGIGEQTWNGTSWGVCTVVSCTDGYTGTNCEIPPKLFLSNCSANGQIYYADNSGNKLATVTNAGVATWVSGKSITDLTCAGHIIVCNNNNAGYILQACNAGANTLYTNQTFSSSTVARNSTLNSWAGGLYQWGNSADSSLGNTTATLIVSTAQINSTYYSNIFITGTSAYRYDWLRTQNDNLWGNTTNTNVARIGPCATGYHVPTNSEWGALKDAGVWSTNGLNLSNTLKLPMAGYRYRDGAIYAGEGGNAYYRSSTPTGTSAYLMNFTSTGINTNFDRIRTEGYSVRCFKN